MDGRSELTKHQLLLLEEILIERIQLCRGNGTLIVEAVWINKSSTTIFRQTKQRRGVSRLDSRGKKSDPACQPKKRTSHTKAGVCLREGNKAVEKGKHEAKHGTSRKKN